MNSTLRRYTGAELFAEQGRGLCVVDVRPAARFAAFHLRGALPLGVDGPLASWAALLLPPEQRILLVGDSLTMVEEAWARLRRVGLGGVEGYVLADERRWRDDRLDVRSLRTWRCAEVAFGLQQRTAVIDVRSRAEWLQGHVPGARCVPLLELAAEGGRQRGMERVLVYCKEGFRAMIAASLLLRGGSTEVEVVLDGLGGWTAAGLSLVAGEAGVLRE